MHDTALRDIYFLTNTSQHLHLGLQTEHSAYQWKPHFR